MNAPLNIKRWLIWKARIILWIGVAVGLATLVAPMGVWLGFWSFGTGFKILGTVNPYTGIVVLACVVAAVSLFIAASIYKTENAVRLATLAMIGAMASGIAWYVPNTFKSPEGQSYPPIHDVSTDLDNMLKFVAVLSLRANVPNTTVYGGAPNMTPERNAKLQREAYPTLTSQYYEESEEAMFTRALSAVNKMGWKLVDAAPEEGRIEATATTFWFRFKDDIVIRIKPANGQAQVDARSLSRVGGGDAGANAKRLLGFFELL